jgi:membrane-bound serine protease (ClpP class)
MGRVLVLDDAQDPDAGWTSPGESPELLGRDGIVHSALRPAGTVLIDGDRINAVSSGVFIEKDRPVLVVEVEGHRVVVEEILSASAS